MISASWTPGPWLLCHHLKSVEHDKSCSCGYRGGIGGPDGEHTICEMGPTIIPGEEWAVIPGYDRETEVANAHLIAAAPKMAAAIQSLIDSLEGRNVEAEDAIGACREALAEAQQSCPSGCEVTPVEVKRAAPQPDTIPIKREVLERVISELEQYAPEADEYKGKYIHKGWARRLRALLATREPQS